MRWLSYILILFGVYWLASAGYDEFRGITTKPPSFSRRSHHGDYIYSIPVRRDQNPELFHQFIVTRWIYAVVVEGAGWVLYRRYRMDDGAGMS